MAGGCALVWSRGYPHALVEPPLAPYARLRTEEASSSFPYHDNRSGGGGGSSQPRVVWLRNHSPQFFTSADAQHYLRELLQLREPFVLVTTDGDHTMPRAVPDYERLLRAPQLVRWFTQNLVVRHPKLTPVPIGMDLHTQWDPTWPRTPDARLALFHKLRRAAPPLAERRTAVFTEPVGAHYKSRHNHGILREFDERTDAARELRGCPLVSVLKTRLPKRKLLARVADARFALSPAGNGVDCHRTWEVMAVGTIPIVKRKGLAIDALYAHRPVLLVDAWAQVCNASFLDEAVARLSRLPPRMTYHDFIPQIPCGSPPPPPPPRLRSLAASIWRWLG